VYRAGRIKRIIVAAVIVVVVGIDVSLLFDCSGQLVPDIGRTMGPRCVLVVTVPASAITVLIVIIVIVIIAR